ncbi:MAG: aspartate aminotransferase family protein [Alphaproteobacteria bacterium]|nr:aspartate aminotransferase family protein [Alphaproteobacteria bacterium]
MSYFPVLMPVYNRVDLHMERGEGAYVFDDKGNRYLDFLVGVGVVSLGHCHPHVVEALKKQAEALWTVSNLFKTHSGERLAQRLVDLTFADTVFFQNSGVEAWECGIKTMRKYFSATGKPERYRVVTFKGNFHGRTMTAIAASKSDKMVGGFGPLIDGFDLAEFGDIESVRAVVTDETAGIAIEPIVGEGGFKVPPAGFLRQIRELCDEKGMLLMFDEVQCGMGRSGKLFAHEWDGVVPDIMCIAKALGNGFPIGACLATAKAAQGMTKGTHGSTYGGNPLATEVGNAVLDIMTTPGFLEEVRRKGDVWGKRLEDLVKAHPKVFSSARGRGLMRGLVCVPPNGSVSAALRDEKLLAIEAGENVVRFLPPLVVTDEQLDEAAEAIDRAAKKLGAVA